VRVLVRRSHRELVHVGLAQDDRSGGVELLDDVRVVGRHEICKHAGRAGRAPAAGAVDVLLRDWNAGERAAAAPGHQSVGGLRLFQAAPLVDRDKTVVTLIQCFDSLQEMTGKLDAREAPAGKISGKAADGGVVHQSERAG